jgi:hypothetical protein
MNQEWVDLRAVAEVEVVDGPTVAAELLARHPDISPEEVVGIATDRSVVARAARSDGAT